jgi:tRNA threonylcarbamoyl adenosine modification protein YeaZ
MSNVCWLAIDTTGQGCHIGLTHQGQTITRSDMSPQSHAKLILPMIEDLLKQAQLNRTDLTGIIYTQGPGSFTGVRIGVSVVQGLAMALNVPTLGVSSLLALAWQGHLATAAERITAVIDARMGQVYWGSYQLGQQMSITHADSLSTPDVVSIDPATELLIGDLASLIQAQPSLETIAHHHSATLSIETLFSLVKIGIEQGFLSWDNTLALPVYLRHDVAALPKKQAGIVKV